MIWRSLKVAQLRLITESGARGDRQISQVIVTLKGDRSQFHSGRV